MARTSRPRRSSASSAARPKSLAAPTFPWLLVTGDDAAMPLNPELDLRMGEFRDDTYRDALAAVPEIVIDPS